MAPFRRRPSTAWPRASRRPHRTKELLWAYWEELLRSLRPRPESAGLSETPRRSAPGSSSVEAAGKKNKEAVAAGSSLLLSRRRR